MQEDDFFIRQSWAFLEKKMDATKTLINLAAVGCFLLAIWLVADKVETTPYSVVEPVVAIGKTYADAIRNAMQIGRARPRRLEAAENWY